MTPRESGSEPASPVSTSPPAHNATTTELNRSLPLIDRFARVHRSIRISVTDRCNIRCQYCMPAGDIQFLNEQRLLDFESITQFVSAVSEAGIRKVRITGGEPLMRPRLEELIAKLNAIPTIEDIALTTNGMLLADKAEALRDAGLKRINISLDTLRDETFRRLSRRDGLDKVLAGIAAATERTHWEVRLNALVMRDINLDEVYELVEFAGERGLTMRFIEFMPLDADRAWTTEQMVSGAELRERLQSRFGIDLDRLYSS
ncbi:MAG: radical SAM protein [Pirellulales bacterium]